MSTDRETRLGILARRVAKLKAQRADDPNLPDNVEYQLALAEAVLELYTRQGK